MRTAFRESPRLNLAPVVILFSLLLPASFMKAAQLKEAQVTQIVKEVQLLPGQAAPRPAAIRESVREGTAVRTGDESRTELTFADQTLARLGANTLFSFKGGTRNLDLGGGAMLLSVPKDARSATVRTAAVTAAITGGTALLEHHGNAYCKFISIEGTLRVYLKSRLGESVLLHPGQMLIVPPNAKSLPDPVDIDLERLLKTCLLIIDFPPLGNQPLITEATQHQQDQKADGVLMDTNMVIVGRGTLVTLVDPNFLDVIDQINAIPGVGGVLAFSEIGPLNTIMAPNPYVINNTTKFVTAPTITTNGVTDVGKFYRGGALDGVPATYMFGSSNAFDGSSGFNEQLVQSFNLPIAVFKFTSLRITGNATVTIPAGGATKLALISIGDLTSGPPGGTLTFTGLDTLMLFTQNGLINLTADVSFSNLQFLFVRARGSAGANLTIASTLTGIGTAELDAEGSVQVNAAETVTSFRVTAGVDFLDGTGHITAQNIAISAGNNVNFTTLDFAVPIATATNVFLQAGATANVDIRTDQSVFANANLVTIMANTLSFTTDPAGDTLVFKDLTPVQFTIGSGGIQAAMVKFLQASNNMNFLSQGNITAARIVGGDGIQSTAGNINTTGDLVANFVFANGSITSGGDLFGFQSISAGTTINVTNTLLSPQVIAGGNITAGHIEVQNINPGFSASSTTLTAGAGGITPFIGPSGSGLQHTFNVSKVVSPNGIDFNGSHFGTGNNGGLLTINAQNQTFSAAGINGANFNGGDNTAPGGTGGSGGILTVNTNGDLSVSGVNIDATSGMIDINALQPSGAGGTVNLTSAAGPVSVTNSRIRVSSSDAVGQANRRSSAKGGNITLSSGATSAVAINVTSTAQLLSLLENTAPGPGGLITINATAPTGNAQLNVSGLLQAGGSAVGPGAIDIRHSSDSGIINVANPNMIADIIKIAALGDNSTLNVGGGIISATTLLRLYAGTISNSNNATINFVKSCTLNGTEIDIAAHTVNLLTNVTVTTGSQAHVYTIVANYQGSGGTGGATTGMFVGAGATTLLLLSAPAIGPPGGP